MKLVYDIGLHMGEDSDFYLRKGFRVVGVDADPAMCEAAAERLHDHVRSEQLIIVNAAIAESAGIVTLFRNAKPDWSTIVRKWSDQNSARGSPSRAIAVKAMTLADLVGIYGDAYYMKIDIEGMDRLALDSLAATRIRPSYLSIESAFPRDPSLKSVRRDLDALVRLGYDRFKVVAQHRVEEQVPPNPPKEGKYVPIRFTGGSSGLFGEEAPGEWLSADAAFGEFRGICRRDWLQVQLHRNMALYARYCDLVHRLTGRYPSVGWFDIHARHETAD